jgi:tetratricopeptide (TPR) repeat protein
MLKRTVADPRRPESGTQVALTDVAAEYMARFAPPPPKLFERVQGSLKRLREMTEKAVVQEAAYKYDIFSVRAESRDERISAVYLQTALQLVKGDKITEAKRAITKAKDLLPTFAEAYRISAIVESRGNDLYKAVEEIETAINLNLRSAVAHYQYALFLLHELEDSQSALAQIDAALQLDPGDHTLGTVRALALTRLGRLKEAADLYEQLLQQLSSRPRKWRITTRDQAAECYRRWGEQDHALRDPGGLRAHLDRALQILEAGFGSGDFDSRMGTLYVNIVEDGLFAGLHAHDHEYIGLLLARLHDASFVADCPPFRTLTLDHLRREFEDRPSFLDEMRELTERRLVRWSATAADLTELQDRKDKGPHVLGTVKSLPAGVKYGFITDGSGNDWFFHQNYLLHTGDWMRLREGQAVRFRIGVNKAGKCAVQVEPQEGPAGGSG